MTRASLFVLTITLLPAACLPTQDCFTDDDCGIGRCVDAECVECAGDSDCDDDEQCDDGACEELGEGEGEGEGGGEGEEIGEGEGEAEGEGEEGEGEGEAGEGEGEEGEGEGGGGGDGEGEGGGEGEGEDEGDGTFACGPFWVCAAEDRCVSLDDDTARACFRSCTLGAPCETSWGLAGACEPVDGVNVCVATAPPDGACGSFGNARCGTGESCIHTSELVSSCFQACDPSTHACAGDRTCYEVTATEQLICVVERGIGESCGIEDDGGVAYCDPTTSGCDFSGLDGVCTGAIGEGEGEGPVLPGGGGGGGGGGGDGSEGEGEAGEEGDECFSDFDCEVLSYSLGTCETEADCSDTQGLGSNNHCAESSQGGRCVLKSLDDPACEDLPESFPLEVAGGISTAGDAIDYCAVAGSECNNGRCQGPSF